MSIIVGYYFGINGHYDPITKVPDLGLIEYIVVLEFALPLTDEVMCMRYKVD